MTLSHIYLNISVNFFMDNNCLSNKNKQKLDNLPNIFPFSWVFQQKYIL